MPRARNANLDHFRLAFFQVWAVRQSVFGFSPPAELSEWTSVFDVFSFDLGGVLFPSWTCVGGMTFRLAFSGLWPLVLILAVAGAHVAHEAKKLTSLSEIKVGEAIDTTATGRSTQLRSTPTVTVARTSW